MPHLVLDLETIHDPEMPPYVPRPGSTDTFAPPPYWQIVVCGLLWLADDWTTKRIAVAPGADERAILESLINVVETKRPTLVTFNGRGFDLPVLTARVLRHGLSFPYRFSKDVTYRYSDTGALDVMDVLSDHGAGRSWSLDAAAKLVGMPGKDGTAGGDVAEMVAQGRLADVQNYCLGDVVQTAAVLLRLQLARGMMPRAKYITAAESLLTAVDGEPRLSALGAKINRDRLLLREGAPGKAEAA